MNVSDAEPRRGETIVRSTLKVPARERAVYWREAVSKVIPSLVVDYLTDEPPRARLESRPFSDAQVSHFIDRTPACHVTHTPSRLGWPEAYLLVLQLAGSGRYRHAGREVVLESGDLILLDLSKRLEIAFPKSHHELVWVLPRETLAPLLGPAERVAVGISGRHGFGALLAGSARIIADEAGRLDAHSQRTLKLHLCNLTAMTLGATLPVEEVRRQSYRLARRQQILAYVEANLGEVDLTTGRVARDLKMSRRWLHELFSEGGTGIAAWIARRRIEECRRLLEDPRHDHLSISAIAFRYGFNDLATFYRQFRAHCGKRPRDVRRDRAPKGKGS